MASELAPATRHHHAAADGDRLAIMERPSTDRYRAFLAQVYCFEAPVEAALIATAGTTRWHLKSAKLAGDLEAMGLVPGEVLPTTRLRFAGHPEALGWMWVLHRNTLLHGLIFRYLQGKLPEAVRMAGAYLSVFEGRAGALMREIGDAMESAAREPGAAPRIIHAANEAFRLQRQWYACDLLAPRRPAKVAPHGESALSSVERSRAVR